MSLLRFFIIIISTFVLMASCDSGKEESKQPMDAKIAVQTKTVAPSTSVAVFKDKLIFGKDNITKPITVKERLPRKEALYSSYKVIPGKSNIHLSQEQRLSGMNPEMSKAPNIVEVDWNNIVNKSLDLESLSELKVLEPMEVFLDSIGFFREMAIAKSKYKVVDGDTILPPMRVIAGQPKLIRSENPRYKYDALCNIVNFNTDQQLPNSFIRSIVKDDNNVFWIGSAGGGIISYDGQYIEQYTKEQGLMDDDIYHLIRDSKGRFWSGSFIGDLTCFDGKYFTIYGPDQGLKSTKIMSLYEDKEGNIWVGTNKYMVIFDGEKFRYLTKEDGLPDNVILSVLESEDGTFWFTSRDNGIASYKDNKFTYFNEENGLESNFVLSSLEDRNGNMWFTTLQGGVSKFNGKSFVTYNEQQGLGNNTILDVVEDVDGNLWFATFGSGITKFDGEAFQYFADEQGLLDNYIRTLYADKNGYIWIGTDGVGLSILKPDNFVHLNKDSGLSNDLVLSIYQDNDDNMWFGTFDGGILAVQQPSAQDLTPSLVNISSRHGLTDSLVVSITQDKNNDYWIGTFRKGLSKIDAKSYKKGYLKITNYTTDEGLNSNNVNKVFTDSKGNLWAGTKIGPCVVTSDGILGFDTLTPLHRAEVVEIFEDMDNNMWFGTKGDGVFKVTGDKVYNFNTKTGFVDDIVWCITQTENGNMFFGTDMGLQFLIGDQAGSIDIDDGLSNNQVYSIINVSDSNMWVGTTQGLNFISMDFNEGSIIPEITTYNKLEGLISDDFYHNSALRDNNGIYWFGTLKGLTRFNEKTFHIKPDLPISHIKEIRINGQTVNFWDEFRDGHKKSKFNRMLFTDVQRYNNIPVDLELPYGQNHITFFFSGTEWHASSKVMNQYKLEGLDNNWSITSRDNIADYRNLPSGHYTFIVRSSNSSGEFGDPEKFSFRVLPPWYETWFALFFYFALAVFIVYLIVKWRVSLLQKQKMVLEQKVNHRTKELDKALVLANQAADAKSHFIATISHELRTPLNAIIGLSHVARKNTVDRKIEDYLKKIDRSADTLLKLINEILDFSKIEAGKMKLEEVEFNMSSVVDTVIELNAQSAIDKGLEFIIRIDPELPENLIGDPLRIGQVIVNLCNNAIKFTHEGVVIVSIEKEEEVSKNEIFVQVSIKDTGIGISDEQKPVLFEEFKQADSSTTRKYGGTGLGLSISKLFIEMMGGQIWLDSKLDEGSTFYFDFKTRIQESQPDSIIIPEALLNKEILVCDSNLESLNTISQILSRNSMKYDTASSSKGIFEKMKLKNYDLLIVSNNIDDNNGLDIILKLRSEPGGSELKTILVTDLISSVDNFERTIKGINGYLTKPILALPLIDKIFNVFDLFNDSEHSSTRKKTGVLPTYDQLVNKTILLAEDNDLNQQVIIELAGTLGMKVDVAKNGSEALQKALEKRYDLILMDLHMPVMDGFSSAQQIRNNNIDTPIIAVTADAMQSVDDACKKAGMNGIITKPINPNYFYGIISKWILGNSITDKTAEGPGSSAANSLLDLVSGIRRLGGDKDLYRKMLNKFIDSTGENCSTIISLVETGKFEKAFLLAHSLKGESGNLGAVKVSEKAQELEDAIKDNRVQKVREICDGINLRISQIAEQMKSNPNVVGEIILTEFRPVDTIVAELIDCLKTSNPKVFDLIDEMEDKDPENKLLVELKKMIKDGDTDSAIDLLKRYNI